MQGYQSRMCTYARKHMHRLPAQVKSAVVSGSIDEDAVATWLIIARMGKVSVSGACPASDSCLADLRGFPPKREQIATEVSALIREGLVAIEYRPFYDGTLEGRLVARYDRFLTVPFDYSWDLPPLPFED